MVASVETEDLLVQHHSFSDGCGLLPNAADVEKCTDLGRECRLIRISREYITPDEGERESNVQTQISLESEILLRVS